MQSSDAIVHWSGLAALALSIAVHATLLTRHPIYTSPAPQLAKGRTAVQLTILRSPAAEQNPAIASPELMQAAPSEQTPSRRIAQEIPQPISKANEDDIAVDPMQGVITAAQAMSPFHPEYPRISFRRGEEGTVTMTVQVKPDGTVGRVEILNSSGYRRLDQAAVHGAAKTTFQPALRNGRPVDGSLKLSYTFRIPHE